MWLLSHFYIFSLSFTLHIYIFICSTSLLKAPKEVVNTDFDFIYKKIEKIKKNQFFLKLAFINHFDALINLAERIKIHIIFDFKSYIISKIFDIII